MKKILQSALVSLVLVGASPIQGFGQTGSSLPKTQTYAVGNYYPDPQNPTSAVGVVFYTSEDGKCGKIVSLDEGNGAWGDPRRDESEPGAYLFAKEHKVSGWLDSVRNHYTSVGRWYLPSEKEIRQLYQAWNGSYSKAVNKTARTAFDRKLIQAGGIGISDGCHWCGMENSPYQGRCIDLTDCSRFDDMPKTQVLPIRAIASF